MKQVNTGGYKMRTEGSKIRLLTMFLGVCLITAPALIVQSCGGDSGSDDTAEAVAAAIAAGDFEGAAATILRKSRRS